MDVTKNPFEPGAGTYPPELVGRDNILDDIRILLKRVIRDRSHRSMMLTGLRGVGKTVLLVEALKLATSEQYRPVFIEVNDNTSLASSIVPELRGVLLGLDRLEGARDKLKHAFSVVRSFISGVKLSIGETISLGIDVEPATGTADSGDIELDLPKVLMAVGEAAKERSTGIALIIDEVQYLTTKELGALIMAMHRIQQLRLPVVMIAAGLPSLPGLAGHSKSYAERLFLFPQIGALSKEDSATALQEPAQSEGVTFEPSALDEIFGLTKGYPYFIQEWGYQAWNQATSSFISLQDVQNATRKAIAELDGSFFRVRFERLTPKEKLFLRAMAEIGPGKHRTGDIALKMGVKVSSISPRRDKLIQKGMIYTPSYGDIAFTVPLFDEFMKRTMPEFAPNG